MNQVVTLDGAKLKQVGHASHTAEVTITALALRERLRHFSDITRTRNQLIRQGERVVDEDYMAFWKGLQDAGVGTIIFGRKGKPDRFQWHYSMKKVAQAALEGTNEVAEKIAGPSRNLKKKKAIAKLVKSSKPRLNPKEKEQKVAQAEIEQTPSGRNLVYIPLRPDFDLEIAVPPKGYSADEIEVINRALRRLSA